jgi:tetrathionate reductase subunit B
MKAFRINVDRCNGCYCCQIGCKDEHCGNDWTPYAKPQPLTGHFWGKLNDYVRGQNYHVKESFVFVPCQHCEDATCIAACPVNAIYRRSDGLVIIDPKLCNGCKNCLNADACPYGVIYFNTDSNIAQKCTGCAHLVDRGAYFAPRCADNCPIDGTLVFGEEDELDLSGTETLHPEYGLTPRVHYIGLPKRFIAGTVFDSGADEVVIGATCTLTGDGGTKTATTDHFGDFWFDGLAADTFSLSIAATGFDTKTIDSISTVEEDIGLPDIDLA